MGERTPGPGATDGPPEEHETVRRRALRLVRLSYRLLLSLLPFLFPAWTVLSVWTAGDRVSWFASMATLTAFFVVLEGLGAPAQHPRLVRRTVEGVGLAAVLSVCRLPSLRAGHDLSYPLVSLVLLAVALAAVARARLHRWGAPLSRPLRFPLEGTWYVVHGGGRLINHHAPFPEQRGAVDLTGLGRYGTRSARDRADVTAYAAYGRPVFAPCRGRVVSAGDGIEDQRPGAVRRQPLYGNHVFIDTGREIVKLAHLRPGSLRVRAGDEVEAGQLLGEVGNSGNSTEPHLHLHAERDGVGLDLAFSDVPGRLYRGRTVRTTRMTRTARRRASARP
ncbi:M23 family metallopeptidase [Streptomyces sp. L2]|uniref:M23 family metallopeptidase n=1 Tax=Streptomyces sp. L2 TaxID=2162665 RepID=UPI0013E9225B|nr:M23 family metallopeptidase [Streptomyces sp. L2]